MEGLGVIVFIILLFVGLLIFMKHSRVIGWWVSTPYYDREYRKKMLKRVIEDAQDELEKLENK